MNKEQADYYRKLDNNQVQCLLCPHICNISEGDTGLCGVRTNKNGELYSENYARISSIGIDPIEKKPLYHFLPGCEILSIGTTGCNLSCSFCQNWRISQEKPKLRKLNPEEVIDLAQKKDVIGIAYTYSEPSVWFEYVRDTARLAKEASLKNVLVSNGFINQKPLQDLLPYIDAANIDLKSIKNEFYHKYCNGQEEPVKRNIKLLEDNIHLEITTLLITGLNDSQQELKELFTFIKDINPEIPLHLSRYFPAYQMDKPPTPVKKMKDAYSLAKKHLANVYLGNVNVKNTANTYCPDCEEELIVRNGYYTSNIIEAAHCPDCGRKIYGEFN